MDLGVLAELVAFAVLVTLGDFVGSSETFTYLVGLVAFSAFVAFVDAFLGSACLEVLVEGAAAFVVRLGWRREGFSTRAFAGSVSGEEARCLRARRLYFFGGELSSSSSFAKSSAIIPRVSGSSLGGLHLTCRKVEGWLGSPAKRSLAVCSGSVRGSSSDGYGFNPVK